jgi:hypothetical protein
MSALRSPLAVVVTVAVMTLLGLPVAAIVAGTGWWLLKYRLAVLALLLVAQGVTLSRAPRLAPLGWLLVMSAAVGVLGGRDPIGPDTSVGWTCLPLFVGFGLVPLAVVTWALRDIPYDRARAFTAGLGVATVGLFWGELRCQRSIGHVLVLHFGAALLLLGACMLGFRLTAHARSRNPGLPA